MKEDEEVNSLQVEHKYIIIIKINTDSDKLADNAVVIDRVIEVNEVFKTIMAFVDYNTVLARDVVCSLEWAGIVEIRLAPIFITF